MGYSVDYTHKAEKQLNGLDMPVRKRLQTWIHKNLEGCENPRTQGKALTGNRKGYWRYSVGDYRIIADIQDTKIIILVTEVGHRKEIYRKKG